MTCRSLKKHLTIILINYEKGKGGRGKGKTNTNTVFPLSALGAFPSPFTLLRF
jgi:hypothetical protein